MSLHILWALLSLIAVSGSFFMIIKGVTLARITGAVILVTLAGFSGCTIGEGWAIHSDNGRFNNNIGRPSEWLFDRLRLLSEKDQMEAVRKILIRLDQEATLYPMSNRNQRPFHDLVREILADTSNLVANATGDEEQHQATSVHGDAKADQR